jgi:hypothetical protein
MGLLRDRGCREIEIEVFAHNAASLKMCLRAGFKVKGGFTHPGDPGRTVVFKRAIDPWVAISPPRPRYSCLRGRNIYLHHAALAEALADSFSKVPGVELILGLGSLARGFADEWSDLDLAVLGRGAALDQFWTGERWFAGVSVDLFVVDLDASPPQRWDASRRQAYEESRVLYKHPRADLRGLQRSTRLGAQERRTSILEILFKVGWLGFAPREWFMQTRYGYLWSLPPDEWQRRGCAASAHVTVDRVLDLLLQLLFLLNRQHIPDPKWRRFLVTGLNVLPKRFVETLQQIERLPRDPKHLKARADRLLNLVEATTDILEKEGLLRGDLYSAFLQHCPDYDPKT